MDRLAAHVIATAALTVTLATVPVLFADASHAATRSVSVPATATPSSWQAIDARTGTTARSTEPPLAAETQTAPARTAAAAAALPPPGTDRTYTLPQAGRPCADLRPVGGTTHARYHGMIAFSVRQYYSAACRSFYGYSFAWQRFRKLHVRYDVAMAVFDDTRDAIVGPRTYVGGAGGPTYWSAAAPAAKGDCTRGEGHYFYGPAGTRYGFEEGDTMSPKVCA
jgi:hypothetical protein